MVLYRATLLGPKRALDSFWWGYVMSHIEVPLGMLLIDNNYFKGYPLGCCTNTTPIFSMHLFVFFLFKAIKNFRLFGLRPQMRIEQRGHTNVQHFLRSRKISSSTNNYWWPFSKINMMIFINWFGHWSLNIIVLRCIHT
jgi:hypothetical protein